MDAVADALTAEAVYQIVRGNPVGALINIEAIADGSAPPELHVTETPASGIRLTHRVVVALPANATPTGWQTKVTPRSRAEPLLDVWCGLLLGPAADVAIVVERAGGTTVPVRLSTLGVSAIDVVLSGRNRGSELAELVIRAASSSSPGLTGAASAGRPGVEGPGRALRSDRASAHTWREPAPGVVRSAERDGPDTGGGFLAICPRV